ncbi:kinase-like domain-containing protein [Tricladium varicosporioides]|nr:kinase-like domain-containing protein [Hymenoscyphus varicosporioides]
MSELLADEQAALQEIMLENRSPTPLSWETIREYLQMLFINVAQHTPDEWMERYNQIHRQYQAGVLAENTDGTGIGQARSLSLEHSRQIPGVKSADTDFEVGGQKISENPGLNVSMSASTASLLPHKKEWSLRLGKEQILKPRISSSKLSPQNINTSSNSGTMLSDSFPRMIVPGKQDLEVAQFPSNESAGDRSQHTMEQILEDDYDLDERPVPQEKWGIFRCEHPSCWDRNDKFRFHVFADLAQHYKDAHPPIIENESYPCDYPTCKRADDEFFRKDAYRDHLREFHLEDMPKRHRSTKREREWLACRIVSPWWWRCARCLSRRDVKHYGWTCNDCKQECEPERIQLRQRSVWDSATSSGSQNSSETTLSYMNGITSVTASHEAQTLVHRNGWFAPQAVDTGTSLLASNSSPDLPPGDEAERLPGSTDLFSSEIAFAHREYSSHKTVPFVSVKQLGHGSLGSVDAVLDMDNRERPLLARKVIRLPNMSRKRLLPLIQQEVEVLRGLSHKHIVRILSTYETISVPRQFGILIFPAGDEDLSHCLERIGEDDFPPRDIQRLMKWQRCLASAVDYIHSKNIRHKDIKPSNAICKGEEIYLTDFGSAHQFSAGLTSSTEGYALGVTKMYSAPEVVDEDRRGRSADIYSLGCVFAEMSTVVNKRTVEEFHEFRSEPIPDEPDRLTMCYYATSHRLQDWFAMHDDKEIFSLISTMMATDQKLRPSAKEVLAMLEHQSNIFSCSCRGDRSIY